MRSAWPASAASWSHFRRSWWHFWHHQARQSGSLLFRQERHQFTHHCHELSSIGLVFVMYLDQSHGPLEECHVSHRWGLVTFPWSLSSMSHCVTSKTKTFQVLQEEKKWRTWKPNNMKCQSYERAKQACSTWIYFKYTSKKATAIPFYRKPDCCKVSQMTPPNKQLFNFTWLKRGRN